MEQDTLALNLFHFLCTSRRLCCVLSNFIQEFFVAIRKLGVSRDGAVTFDRVEEQNPMSDLDSGEEDKRKVLEICLETITSLFPSSKRQRK